MVSTTTYTATPIAAFGPCFNDTPIKTGVASVATPALAVAMGATPAPPPAPVPRPPTVELERVVFNGVAAKSVQDLLTMGKTGNTTATGAASTTTPASFSDEEEFKRGVDYFKALLAAREEMVEKYANKLKTLRSLRARNNRNIRKRNNLKARKLQKARAAARTAGTEAGAVATGSEATTTVVESMATTGSVGSGSVGSVVEGRGWHDEHCRDIAIDGGRICASPVSMDEERVDNGDCAPQQCGHQEMGMQMNGGMYYSA